MNRKIRSSISFVLVILLMIAGALTAAAAVPEPSRLTSQFKDVTPDNANILFIEYLANLGFAKGFPDGTFRPREGLTRAEAAAMLGKVSGMQAGSGVTRFKDVPANHWAAGAISAAETAGLLKGYPDGTFRPNARLTRAEGIALVMKLTKQPDPGTLLPEIADVKGNHWAQRPIAIGLAAEMISLTSDGTNKFLPDQNFTRGALARAVGVLITSDPEWYQADMAGQLKVVKGIVTVARNGQLAENVSDFVQLTPGDVIKVGPSGSAEINFPDGSGLKLSADTELVFNESLGRSYIKPDGTQGTGLEWMTVDLKKGRVYGALATQQTEPEKTAISGPSFVNQGIPSGTVTTAGLSDWLKELFKKDDPLNQDAEKEWYKVSKSKRVKVKVDMPWGVAAVRGTFWLSIVNLSEPSTSQEPAVPVSCETIVLTGEVEVEEDGQKVTAKADQKIQLIAPAAPPPPPLTVTKEEKKEQFQQAVTWVVERAKVIDEKKEAVLPPPPPAQKELPPPPPPTVQTPPGSSQPPGQQTGGQDDGTQIPGDNQTPGDDTPSSGDSTQTDDETTASTVSDALGDLLEDAAEETTTEETPNSGTTGGDNTGDIGNGSGDPTPSYISVTGISLNKTATSIFVGQTETITAAINPYYASNPTVVWSSNSPAVTVVNGVITGVAAGTAVIRAVAYENYMIFAEITVQVNPILVASVNLSTTANTIMVGGSAAISASITPSNATNKALFWSSSNPNAATVNQNGVVTAVGEGRAVITATAADQNIVSGQITFEVFVPIFLNATNISLTTAGEPYVLTAVVTPSVGTNTVNWSSSAPTVADVIDGIVVPLSAGSAVITASVTDTNNNTYTATCTVIVAN